MMRLSLLGLAALAVVNSVGAAEWSVVVQPIEPRCAKRMMIAGAKQDVRVETDGGVKRFVANDGTSAVLVWNMTTQSVRVSVGGLGVASETAEPDTGTVAADAPLMADTLRLYVFGR